MPRLAAWSFARARYTHIQLMSCQPLTAESAANSQFVVKPTGRASDALTKKLSITLRDSWYVVKACCAMIAVNATA